MKYQISEETIAKIKELEKTGMSKRRISEALVIPICIVQKYTEKKWKKRIPDELRELIRSLYKKGDKTKIEITKELISEGYNISYDNVLFHTKDLSRPRNSPSKQLIEKMRTEVQNGKTKRQVALEMQIPYPTLRYYTMLIPSHSRKHLIKSSNDSLEKSSKSSRCLLTDEIIQHIRESVKEGKSRYQMMQETNVSFGTIKRITADLPFLSLGWPGLRGKTLEIIQQVVKNGYIILPTYNKFNKSHNTTLRKYFPTVQKRVIHWGNKYLTIVFLEERGIEAMWVVLEQINKTRMISDKKYRELIDIFIPGKNRREKKRNLLKYR